MAARSLGLAAGFGLAANAFLLPPGISTSTVDADADFDLRKLVDSQGQTLLVPCANCGLDKADVNDLLLDFSIGSEPGTLELGGEPIYPARSSVQPSAVVVPAGTSIIDGLAEPDRYTPVTISGNLVINRVGTFSEEEDGELLQLTLDIDSLGGRAVSVPTVMINVAKDSEARLSILSTSHTAPEVVEMAQDDEPACQSALCEWTQFIEAKIHGISAAAHKHFGSGRPCPGKAGMAQDGDMPHGAFINMHHGPNSYHHRPIFETGPPRDQTGPPRPHGPAGFHGAMHRAGNVIMAIVKPVAFGIAAGAITYVAGMLVCLLVVFVYLRLRRRGAGSRGYAGVALDDEEAVAKEADGEGRASFESAPPVYEDAPPYEEKQVV